MEDERKLDCAKRSIEIAHASELFAERRSSELADEFTRLEVQVAAILIAFGGAYLDFLTDKVEQVAAALPNTFILIKFMYASSIFFLIASLALGLIHIKRKEKFWDEIMNSRLITLKQWIKTTEGAASYEESSAFQKGVGLEKGNVIFTPKWTWILQTVALGIAVFLFFILFLVFLFTG